MKHRTRVLLLALLCVAGLRAAGNPGAYALTGAKIVRVSGPVIEQGTVLIRGGLIEAVGEAITPPADAWVVDCKGLTIYPGLIDAMSEWGLLNTGPTPLVPISRGPEDRPLNASYLKAADLISPNDTRIESARNWGFTTAVSFPGTNIFAGQGSVFELAGERAGEMVVADAVGQRIILRTSGTRSYPGSLLGTIAYIRQVYLDAERYRLAKSIYEKHPQGLQRPAYDRTLEGVLASPRVLLPASRSYEIERMVALATELKLPAVIYVAHEAWRSVELLKKTNTPVLLSLRFPEKPRDFNPDENEPQRFTEFREKAPGTAGLLAKAQVKFAFYSDGISNPRDLLRAVRKTLDAGLSRTDAVRALTLSAAEIYGVDDRLGSIDKGKIANLVITSGDLLDEQMKIRYVFVDGNQFIPSSTVNP